MDLDTIITLIPTLASAIKTIWSMKGKDGDAARQTVETMAAHIKMLNDKVEIQQNESSELRADIRDFRKANIELNNSYLGATTKMAEIHQELSRITLLLDEKEHNDNIRAKYSLHENMNCAMIKGEERPFCLVCLQANPPKEIPLCEDGSFFWTCPNCKIKFERQLGDKARAHAAFHRKTRTSGF